MKNKDPHFRVSVLSGGLLTRIIYVLILIQRIQYLRFIEYKRVQITLWILSCQELISVYLTKCEQIQDIQLIIQFSLNYKRVVPENVNINTNFPAHTQWIGDCLQKKKKTPCPLEKAVNKENSKMIHDLLPGFAPKTFVCGMFPGFEGTFLNQKCLTLFLSNKNSSRLHPCPFLKQGWLIWEAPTWKIETIMCWHFKRL